MTRRRQSTPLPLFLPPGISGELLTSSFGVPAPFPFVVDASPSRGYVVSETVAAGGGREGAGGLRKRWLVTFEGFSGADLPADPAVTTVPRLA